MRILKHKTHIDFLGPKRRKIALSISAFAVIISLGSLIVQDTPLEFGIDFTGGVLLEVGYPQPADIEAIRSDLAAAGFDDAQVQRFGTDTDVLVRLPPQEGWNPDELREELRRTVAGDISNVQLRRVESVSPQVGKELAEQGGLAMIIVLLLMRP